MAAVCTSAMPLSNICHVRDRMRTGKVEAISLPRTRSVSVTAISSAALSTNFKRVSQWHNSARSVSTTAGSAPVLYCSRNSVRACAILPFIRWSNRSKTRARSARPNMSRMSPSFTVPAPWAMAWSNNERASRAEPSAARAIMASACCSALTPSLSHTELSRPTSSSEDRRRKSKRWHRDNTVTGTLRISVVAKMNLTCSGGSSKVFSRPLKAALESMCTSSMM